MMMIKSSERLFLHLLLIVFVVVLVLYMKPASSTVIRCIEKERQALLLFKQGLVDDHGRLSSWGSEDCCKWKGIKCSKRTSHVIMIDLNARYEPAMSGKISPSLLELQHLNYLDLNSNDFNGTIPHQLGNLTNLQHLNLGFNDGLITVNGNLEWLSHLSSLTFLDMSFINHSKAIDWLQAINMLHSLSELHLPFCELSNVVPQPSSLFFVNSSTSLAVLDLGGNYLSSSIFHWLFNFSSSLVLVDLYQNNLQGSIPDAFHNMKSLESLYLHENELEGSLPKSFGNFCTLQTLYLSSNNFSEEFPKFVQNLSGCAEKSLETLDLSQNQLNGSLPDQWDMSSLTHLYLGDNQLGGSLPDLRDMSSLRALDLSRNHLNGPLPESIGQLSKLEFLDVSYNSLEGNISKPHLSNLPKLWFLDLSCNSLSFDLSSHWVPPFQLNQMKLRACKLGPYFPKWLQNQKEIVLIDISNTEISESIPKWFWDLSPELIYLNLSYNKINGMLPNLSFYFSGLHSLDLSSNHLDGTIPLLPSNLTILDLSQNRFSGPISSLCAITGGALKSIDLSDNLLFGGLPDCWMQLTELLVLNLGNNNLSGTIPSSIGSLIRIETLHLRNNSFFGELPSSLRNCTQLELLDLGENKFSGKIPTWIGKSLSLLIVLSLPSNEFYGSIPPLLCHLKYIQIFDLSRNNISGTIPHCLKNFTAMSQNESLLGTETLSLGHYIHNGSGEADNYVDSAVVVWKRSQQEYRSKLRLVKIIDLSANKLTGKIPEEIAILIELVGLNLSRNNLSGKITPKIGQLKMLNFLDLSQNQLFGEIPSSLSNMDSLGVLDLSYNSLSGKIPISRHLQTFDAPSFLGNPDLCGLPLPKKCPGDETAQDPAVTCGNIQEKGQEGLITRGFYVSMALGFIIGFWGVCSCIFFISSWRYAYFHFLNSMTEWLYVKIAVNMAWLQRRHGG